MISIKADGGITVSSFILNGIASLAGCPVQVPLMKQASAWGAALLAGLNIGLYRDLDEIERIISAKKTVIYHSILDLNLSKHYEGWKLILRDY